jgi:hypothetical protein
VSGRAKHCTTDTRNEIAPSHCISPLGSGNAS